MGSDVEGEDLERALNDAIANVFGPRGQMVNRWLLLAEVLDEDMDRAVWSFTSNGLKRWDSLGLLHHAILLEQTASLSEGDE